jgi:hypothetical protein
LDTTEKFVRPPWDPDIPQIFAVDYDREHSETIGNQDHLRIGDSSFAIPPTSISVQTITDNEVVSLPRSTGGLIKSNGFAQKQVTVELIFSSIDDIFGMKNVEFGDAFTRTENGRYLKSPQISPNSLAALCAQFKRTPIVPISNIFLNDVENIRTVCLNNIVVETLMADGGSSYPNTVRVRLVMSSVESQVFMPGVKDYGSAMIWPLFRWHWRQQFAKNLPGMYTIGVVANDDLPQSPALTQDEMSYFNGRKSGNVTFNRFPYWPKAGKSPGFTGEYQFSVISQSWLNQLAQLDATFEKMTAYAMGSDFHIHPIEYTTQYYESLYNIAEARRAMEGPDHATMEPVDLGSDLILQHIALGFENNFANIRLGIHEQPATQHMGQGNVRIVATFHATSDKALSNIEDMVAKSREIARTQRYETISGFIGFQNEITSLFGVSSIVFTDIKASTIEGFPGQYLVSVEMIDFDRTQRRLETLANARSTGNYYIDTNPVPTPGEVGPKLEEIDPRYIFWDRLKDQLSKDPQGEQAMDKAFDPLGRPTSPWFNMAYIQQAIEQMAAMELYPDLHLPTFERLSIALQEGEIFPKGSSIETLQYQLQLLRWEVWNERGRFVDPDFYVDYPNSAMASTVQIPDDLATGNANYFEAVDQIIKYISNDPIRFTNIDNSVSSAFISALWDEYQPGGLYGPGLNLSSGEDLNNELYVGNGKNMIHGQVNMPQVGNKVRTSLIIPSFAAESFKCNIHVDGQTHTVQTQQDRERFDAINNLSGEDKQFMGNSAKIIFGLADTPDKDNRSQLSDALTAHHPIDIGTTIPDEHGRVVGMLQQLIDNDKSGRLVQAFPSYVMQLVDEGPQMGWIKLFPNFFALQSVKSFSVCTDRRDPISTLTIDMLNIYGNLSNYQQQKLNINAVSAVTNFANAGQDSLEFAWQKITSGATGHTNPSDVLGSIGEDVNFIWESVISPLRDWLPNGQLADSLLAFRRKQNSAVMLNPGVRIHLRAGYGSNGASLPILFNGRIVDVGRGETCQVIAQSDGEELARLIPSAEDEFNTINRPDRSSFQKGFAGQDPGNPFMASGYEPRSLICQMLNSHGEDLFDYKLGTKFWNLIKNETYKATDGAMFHENPIGITHFGNPYLFSAWSGMTGFDSKGINVTEIEAVMQQTPFTAGAFAQAKGLVKPRLPGKTAMLHTASLSGIQANQDFLKIFDDSLGSVLAASLSTNTGFNPALAPWLSDMVGRGVTLMQQDIAQAYGETGENVYAIYKPFDNLGKNIGVLFSKPGIARAFPATAGIAPPAGSNLFGNTLDSINTAFDILSQNNFPDLPPISEDGATANTDVGTLDMGVSFNMYTHNKTVWDIVSFMAQNFPPNVAAVRPFEYRSTLFFGRPYWTMRYDYKRIGAYDLGQFQDDTNDKFYGYPVGYKTRPFSQFHLYDSKINLIDNNIRASEEDTYTDVIAMWYGGQGFGQTRPVPMAQHQTLDRSIMSAMRKTVIVNTDYVGLDTAPSWAAVVGSGGMDWLGYNIAHLNVPFTQLGISGCLNHWVAEKSVRQMTRALLRDYQKLMYQGDIMVLGDPTVWPLDIMYINDEYNDIKGLAGVRRVIHNFGFDTGFVTSIEPDLLCEVKGDNYWQSIVNWFGGYLANTAITRLAAGKLMVMARTRLEKSIMTFGLKLTKRSGFFQKIFSNLKGVSLNTVNKLLGNGLKVDNKLVDQWEKKAFIGRMRFLFLDAMSKSMVPKGAIPADETAAQAAARQAKEIIYSQLQDAITNKGSLVGSKTIDIATKLDITRQLDESLATVLGKDSTIYKNMAEILGRNLSDIEKLTGEKLISRMYTEYMSREMFLGFIKGAKFSAIAAFGTTFKELETDLGVKGLGNVTKKILNSSGKEWDDIVTKYLPKIFGIAIKAKWLGGPAEWALQIIAGMIWDGVSTWWDDQTSLVMVPLHYRGVEFTAGIDGHSSAITLNPYDASVEKFNLTTKDIQGLHDAGLLTTDIVHGKLAALHDENNVDYLQNFAGESASSSTTDGSTNIEQKVSIGLVGSPLTGQKLTAAERQAIVNAHHYQTPWATGSGIANAKADLLDPSITVDNLLYLLKYFTSNGLAVLISIAKNGHHSDGDGRVGTFGWHSIGQAIDIVGVNSVPINNGPLSSDVMRMVKAAINFHKTNSIGFAEGMLSYNGTDLHGSDSNYYLENGVYLFGDPGDAGHIHISVHA